MQLQTNTPAARPIPRQMNDRAYKTSRYAQPDFRPEPDGLSAAELRRIIIDQLG